MIVSLLSLSGCHVFEVVDIPCASDEKCAHIGGDPDTDTDADTDIDTDVDTGPIVGPSLGWIVSGTAASGDRVVAYDAAGSTLAAWTDLDGAGPVAYDSATGEAVLLTDTATTRLLADGTAAASDQAFTDARDVAFRDGTMLVTTSTNLYAYDGTTLETAFEEPLTSLRGMALATDYAVAVDGDNETPDLYKWALGRDPIALYSDFDATDARVDTVFLGPDEEPYVCSSVGAIYKVSELDGGSDRPVAFYTGGATDISACAFDPGDDSWLLFSPALGVIRMDAQSRAEVVFEPPTAYTMVRAAFF